MKNNIMKKFFSIIVILFLITNIATYGRTMPKVKADALYDMQTAYFETEDTNSVMQSAASVLYDSDYSIEDYNEEFGLIRAQKVFKAAYTSKKRIAGWSVVLAAATAYTVFSYGSTAAMMYSPTRRIATELKDKTVIVDVNVFVEKIDNHVVKVKFIPVEKVLQNADGFAFNQMAPLKVIRIYKPQAYQEFFAQVKKNLEQ